MKVLFNFKKKMMNTVEMPNENFYFNGKNTYNY